MNYIVASVVCVCVLLMATFLIRENELLSKTQKTQFVVLALLIVFEIVVDTIALYLYESSEANNMLLKLLKMSEFIVAPIIPAFLAHLISRRVFWSRVKKYFYMVITLNAILQLATIFYPIMFQVSGNAVYSRTHFTYLYLIFLILCFSLLMACSVKTFIQNFYRINSLALITLLLIAGVAVRGICIDSNADWLSITFSYFLFLQYFSNSFFKIDTVTSLLNQKSFMTRKTQINFNTAFIMIDVNNFKDINDTYGHLAGDQCLGKIGEAIYTVYSRDGFCYRSGGDEFIVILKPGVLERMKAQKGKKLYECIEELMKALDKELEHQAKKDPYLKGGVSQGFGIYHLMEDCSRKEDYRTVDEALKYADDRMYEKKTKMK